MKLKKGAKMEQWWINVAQGLTEQYRLISSISGVSIDRLVSYVLDEWVRNNRQLLMDASMPASLKKLISKDSTTE